MPKVQPNKRYSPEFKIMVRSKIVALCKTVMRIEAFLTRVAEIR